MLAGFFIGFLTFATVDRIEARRPTWATICSIVAIGIFLREKGLV